MSIAAPICAVCGETLDDDGHPGRYWHPSNSSVVVPGDAPTDFSDHMPEPQWEEEQ